MTIAILRDAIEGVLSWNSTIFKCLLLAVQSAPVARAGDITSMFLYQSIECLTYGDVKIILKRDGS